MLISFSWLKKYVNLPDSVSAEEMGEKLKMSTVEVEKIENLSKDLENIVVGKIISADKHPNADKLKLCKVDVGNEQLQVVCGGSNVVAGMLVALAKVGAKVRWHGEGDLIELIPASIRNVESFGMICASTEIGLAGMFPLKEEKEILDLTFTKAKAGTPITDALNLGGVVLEIDNKSLSNRPDLWGHYGMAREVSALFNKKLLAYKNTAIKPGKEIKLNVAVEDPALCPRYMAVAMSGVKVGPSPAWLQKALTAVGMRPINSIVDITNYIMLDLGQPMHAFDAARLKQKSIIVRHAGENEEFITLDNQKRKLDDSMLVIADEEKTLAIAGVMGGEESGISDATETIIFESANFEAASIRKTSTNLGLRTDSSSRFEKSLDPNMAEIALNKAVQMVLEICPSAKVTSNVVDKSSYHLNKGPIKLYFNELENKIGGKIDKKEIKRILEHLGFSITVKSDYFSALVPTWRATKDISIPEDIIEEILRVHGFDKIKSTLPLCPIDPPEINLERKMERKIKNILAKSLAFTEVYNYSFVSPDIIFKLGDDLSRYIELDNPLSKERPFLQRHLITNLVENVLNNIAGKTSLRIFEIGKTYMAEKSGQRTETNSNDLLPRQDNWLTAVSVGKKQEAYWDIRRGLETIMSELGFDFKTTSHETLMPWHHPSRSALIMVGGEQVGSIYEMHPSVAAELGIEHRLAALEINIDKLSGLPLAQKTYKPIFSFPASERDLAVLVDKNIKHEDIASALSNADDLLNSVELFDVYEGEGVPENKKSMAYRFVYRDVNRTLASAEVDTAQEKIIKILAQKFNAEIRK